MIERDTSEMTGHATTRHTTTRRLVRTLLPLATGAALIASSLTPHAAQAAGNVSVPGISNAPRTAAMSATPTRSISLNAARRTGPTTTSTPIPSSTVQPQARTSVPPTGTATATPRATATATATPLQTAVPSATPAMIVPHAAVVGAQVATSTSPAVTSFPRIASLYAYKDGGQAATFARYGLVVAPKDAQDGVAALKAANPGGRVLVYLDSNAVYIHTWDNVAYDGLAIYPGWWLTLAGTVLAVPVDAASTTISVVDATPITRFFPSHPDVLIDGETVHVTAIAGNTLTVQRGYWSTATTHAAGTRTATHSSGWPGVWDLNVSTDCPHNPATGQTWTQYLAAYAAHLLATAPWDGVFYDVTNPTMQYNENGAIDANGDNVADGGSGSSGTAWADGEQALFSASRNLMPGAVLDGNGGGYAGTTGQEFENAPNWQGGWDALRTTYLRMAGAGSALATSIINSDTSATGGQDLRTMRRGLAATLMGDGYYAYDGGAALHGQTWWYDEYDNSAGSSLTTPLDAHGTTLTLVLGTGGQYHAGDVLRVPSDPTSADGLVLDDEQMVVQSIAGDTLTVQRGAHGTIAAAHAALTKVLTDAQIAAGQGWLGQAAGGPNATGPVWSRDFAHGRVLLNTTQTAQTVTVGAGYRHLAGTQDPALNNGQTVSTVTVAPGDAVLLVKI